MSENLKIGNYPRESPPLSLGERGKGVSTYDPEGEGWFPKIKDQRRK